jgi:DNA-binding response OmpR family regulator
MAEKILIIDDDLDTLKLVGMMLQKQGYEILAANSGPQGLVQAAAENPQLILLDVMMPEMDGYEVAKQLRSNPATASTPILMFTAKTQLDDKVSGFEAGADDYLTKPTHPTELVNHVKALLSRSARNPAAPSASPAEKRALTIGVLAARGGLGVSTVAVNLGEALRQATSTEVIVAELRPGMGTLGPDMGDADPQALTGLLSGKISELTRQKVREQLFIHETGLRLLFGSTRPKDGNLLNNLPVFEALVNRLGYLAPYLVLDLGSGLTPLAQKMLPGCDLILVVSEPVPNSIMHTHTLLNDLIDLGVVKKKLMPVIVNRIRSDTQLSWSQIEDQLGQTPAVAITPAPELVYLAARMKTPAMAARADSLTAQQFSKLASIILDKEKIR